MERPKGAFTPDEPGALPLDQVLAQISKDDQEEWEYEYSTSETETFYLTVELSYPEFKAVPNNAYNHSRGGYYKDWAEPGTSRPGYEKAPQPKQPTGANSENEDENDGNDNDEDEDTELGQDDQDDGTPLDPALLAMSRGRGKGKGKAKATTPLPSDKQKGKQPQFAKKSQSQPHTQEPDPDPEAEAEAEAEAEEPPETEDIQILDLHTANPLFSYRGRLFEGQWAELVGTEAILAHTSPSSPLPSLRDLPGDISLLAASCSRIMTTEKLPRTKMPEVDALAPIKEEYNIRIPVGKDRTGERAEQINFLQNLMALKLKRGDKDQVTVYATDGKGKDWNDRRPVDYRPRRKMAVSNDEEQQQQQQQQQSGSRKKVKKGGDEAGRRRVGRPSMATRLEGYPVGFGKPRGDFEISVMTPARWEDEERGDEEQEEEDDEDQEEEDDVEDDVDEGSGGSDDDDGDDEDVTMIG